MDIKKLGIFLSGFMLSFMIMPILYELGVPSYAMILTALFGENNIWALVFTFVIVIVLLFRMRKQQT